MRPLYREFLLVTMGRLSSIRDRIHAGKQKAGYGKCHMNRNTPSLSLGIECSIMHKVLQQFDNRDRDERADQLDFETAVIDVTHPMWTVDGFFRDFDL